MKDSNIESKREKRRNSQSAGLYEVLKKYAKKYRNSYLSMLNL